MFDRSQIKCSHGLPIQERFMAISNHYISVSVTSLLQQ